jgi:streptogramin lyase
MRHKLARAFLLAFALTGVLAAMAAAAPTLSEFPLPTTGRAPSGIALGGEGDVWFAESGGAGAIGRITPEGTITEFTAGLTANSQPTGIAADPEGNLWFTERANPGRIGEITPEGTITEFTTGLTANSQPTGIAADPEGNLWFTESANPGRIGRITPEGTITEFTTGLTANSQPTGITAGPDGNLWFTERANPGRIGRITPEGTITEFTTGLTANSQPTGITAGPDGNLWFTEYAGPGAIGRITPEGVITEFTSGLTSGSQPEAIGAGSDGNVYFTEYHNPGQIGRITPAGTITETPTTTSNSQPAGVVTGGDGNLWFTEAAAPGQIGTLTLAPSVAPDGACPEERIADLKALVGPNSQPTTYLFEYGVTSSYGRQTESSSAGSGSSPGEVKASVAGLAPGTTYHFRAVATNASGTTYGPDQTFTTGEAPIAVTLPARAVAVGSATLGGIVNPSNRATTYRFQWGTSTGYGQQVPAEAAAAGSDGSEHLVEQPLEGLAPQTTYHFRIVATNCGGCAEGTSYGADGTFTTGTAPAPVTEGTTVGGALGAPAPLPLPALGHSAGVQVLHGAVWVRLPGTAHNQPMSGGEVVPVGTIVGAEAGMLQLTTAVDALGHVQTATVWGAAFRVSQEAGPGGMTTLTLIARAPGCRRRGAAAAAARRKPVSLWAKDNHGHFSTRGQNSVATVRGTWWGTTELCRGTLTTVRSGAVRVRPLHGGRAVTVHAGHSYLVRR